MMAPHRPLVLTGLIMVGCSFVAPPAQAFVPNNGDLETWTETALTPTRSRSGLPVTLTWGIVPDGTPMEYEFGGPKTPSNLIASMNAAFNGDPNETDVTKLPWFFLFADSYGRWDQVSGIRFVHEPNNTNELTGGGTAAGVSGVRPDMRIGGFDLQAAGFGDDGVLAWNWFPDSGGDMGINIAEIPGFFANPSNHFRLGKNTIQHEIGHGINLDHWEADVLMHPIIRTQRDGIQLDEVRGAHFYFGDKYEETNNDQGNATTALATPLGTLTGSNTLSVGTDADIPTQQIAPEADDFVSISNFEDIDYFSFVVDRPGKVSIDLTPLGGIIDVFGGNDFDANARGNLIMRLLDTDGQTQLALVNDTSAGSAENIVDFQLDEAGEYFVGVGITNDTVQLYRLDLTLAGSLGDLNGDGALTNADITPFVQALTDRPGYESAFPGLDPDVLGDFDGSGVFDNGDIAGFVNALDQVATQVPEPTSLAILTALGLGLRKRRWRTIR